MRLGDFRLHGLSIFEATFDIVKASLPLAIQHQLLPRDAIHASTCQALGIAHIATRDDHFTRLPFLQVWMP
jgi:predicted nucleic acid-binding protein